MNEPLRERRPVLSDVTGAPLPPGWSRNWRRVNGVALDVVEAGPAHGPLVILLHGFPDAWWTWRSQIGPLADRGFRVIAPDLRGYGRSDKPRGIPNYTLDRLGGDILGLADVYGRETVRLVGHDWGGVIAWWVAAHHADRVAQLAVLNAPHPDALFAAIRRHPGQALRSAYLGFFQLPLIPEATLAAGRFAALRRALTASSRPGTFPSADLDRHVAAWARPGALTAMLNYYRALRLRGSGVPARVRVPTRVVWGTRDRFLDRSVAEISTALCDAGSALFLDAGHWVHLEEPAAVNRELERFFTTA